MLLVIDETIPAEKLAQIAKSTNRDLIKDVLIFDVYKGQNIPVTACLCPGIQRTRESGICDLGVKSYNNAVDTFSDELG